MASEWLSSSSLEERFFVGVLVSIVRWVVMEGQIESLTELPRVSVSFFALVLLLAHFFDVSCLNARSLDVSVE